MPDVATDRKFIIRTRMGEGYHLTELGLKNLQHVLTDWLPRAVYFDLTDDAASVEVVARKEYMSNKSLFAATFKRADGSTSKTAEYGEDRLVGKSCPFYDPKKSSYAGKKDGFDERLVIYSSTPVDTFVFGRPK